MYFVAEKKKQIVWKDDKRMNDRPERDIRAWSVASWDNRVRDVDKSVSYGANNKDSRRIGGLREDNIDCTVANNRRDWMTSRLKSRRGNDSARRHPSEPETALVRPASPFTSPDFIYKGTEPRTWLRILDLWSVVTAFGGQGVTKLDHETEFSSVLVWSNVIIRLHAANQRVLTYFVAIWSG